MNGNEQKEGGRDLLWGDESGRDWIFMFVGGWECLFGVCENLDEHVYLDEYVS